jgi:ubiquitin
MPVPEIIHQLVHRFDDNLPSYRSGHYNETQLRQEFLNPFFEALGAPRFQFQ